MMGIFKFLGMTVRTNYTHSKIVLFVRIAENDENETPRPYDTGFHLILDYRFFRCPLCSGVRHNSQAGHEHEKKQSASVTGSPALTGQGFEAEGK